MLKALHRATVEVFTFLSAGQSPLAAVTSDGKQSVDWTVAVRVDPSEDKEHAVLTFPNGDVRERILRLKGSEVEETLKQGSESDVSSNDLAASSSMEMDKDIDGEIEEDLQAEAEAQAEAQAVADTIDAQRHAASNPGSEVSETVAEDGTIVSRELEDDAGVASVSEEVAQAQMDDQPVTEPRTTTPAVQKVNWGRDWRFISIKDPLIKFAVRLISSPLYHTYSPSIFISSLFFIFSPANPPPAHQTPRPNHRPAHHRPAHPQVRHRQCPLPRHARHHQPEETETRHPPARAEEGRAGRAAELDRL